MKRLFRKKAALYCCLPPKDKFYFSTAKLRRLEQQKEQLVNYSKLNDWQIYDIYTDPLQIRQLYWNDNAYKSSLTDNEYPGFYRLCLDARTHLFDIIICQSKENLPICQSEAEHLIKYDLPTWGIEFIEVDNPVPHNISNENLMYM